MPLVTSTAAQRKAISDKLINVSKEFELLNLVNNPSLVGQVEAVLNTLMALVTPHVGAGVATQAVITSAQKITATVTGTGTTGVTPTIVNGVVTALVLS